MVLSTTEVAQGYVANYHGCCDRYILNGKCIGTVYLFYLCVANLLGC